MCNSPVIRTICITLLINLFITLFCILNVTSGSSNDDQYCTIHTKSGSIRGKVNQTLFENTLYFSFRGIPYASPPIGNLRFKAPEKVKPWNNTFNALDFGNDCIQPDRITNAFYGSEDCLFLNVYVPKKCAELNPNTKLPVVYFIFGGEFSHGTAKFYGPDFLMETNIILVTVNSRIGPLGFLNLGTRELSGNMNLKDLVLALKWVRDNIEQFGGDKDNITLFGHSTGASSVNLLMISPQAKHLFQKAILVSGSALNPYMPRRQNHYSTMTQLAESLHYPVSNENDLLGFLQQIDGITLSQKTFASDYVPGYGRKIFNRIWSPCIEDENAIEPFLTQAPFDILTNEHYKNSFDTLYSSTPLEVVPSPDYSNPDLLKYFDKYFQIQLPLEMAHMDYNSEVYKNMSNQFRDFYFDGKHVNATTLDNLSLLMSDIKFLYPIDLNARIQVAKSSGRTYFVKFTAINSWNYSQRKAKKSNYTVKYPTHTDPMFYVFRFSPYPNVISDADYKSLTKDSLQRQIIKNLSNFFMDFAKFGNPMPDSEPLYYKDSNSTHFNFYNITNDGIFYQKDPNRDRMEFWNTIFDSHKQLWNTTFNFHLN